MWEPAEPSGSWPGAELFTPEGDNICVIAVGPADREGYWRIHYATPKTYEVTRIEMPLSSREEAKAVALAMWRMQ